MAQLDHDFKKNQGMQLASWLAHEHGFEPGKLGAQDMVKVLDDQHAVGVGIGSKTISLESAVDGAADWQVGFSFARRDLNQQFYEWLGEPEKLWFQQSTVAEQGKRVFVTEEHLKWSKDDPFEAGRDQIEAALNKAFGMANLAEIEDRLYEPGRYAVTMVAANDALNGVDRVWDEYVANHERIMSEAREDVKAKFSSFDEQLRAFKLQHPDGIPR